ncbi:DUF5988 family protein [Kibdelosporangium aridum]|uniref:DUF5988 family protein n=1 Tax=Kibdelosporangium aridum TaxID=2030 RepID=UPI00068F5921
MAVVRIVLMGGPGELPESVRIQEVDSLETKVKLAYGSGYEHFTYSGKMSDVNGDDLPVFSWCGQTRIAE